MNILNDKNEKDINKHFSFKDCFVNYDSADFRKDFDSFIKNISLKTQKNITIDKKNVNDKDIPDSPSPNFYQGKDSEK